MNLVLMNEPITPMEKARRVHMKEGEIREAIRIRDLLNDDIDRKMAEVEKLKA